MVRLWRNSAQLFDLEADLAVTRARFLGYDYAQAAIFNLLAGFPEAQIGNAAGNYLPGAPGIVGTVDLTLGEKTGWFGGLGCRRFGSRPLTEDNAFRSPATGLLSARAGYTFDNGWLIQLDAFIITNSRSDQITYAYGSFLKTDTLFQACNGPTPPPTGTLGSDSAPSIWLTMVLPGGHTMTAPFGFSAPGVMTT